MTIIQGAIPVLQLQQSMAGVRVEMVNAENIQVFMKEFLHRDNYHFCIICKTGCADFFVEFSNIRISRNTLFFLYPGQLHRLLHFNKLSGWLLLFDPKLVDDQSRIIFEQSLYEQPLTMLTIEEAKWYNNVLDAIYSVFTDDKSANLKGATIQALLSAFIFKTASVHLFREKINMERHTPRAIDITKRFRQLLRKRFKDLKRPSDYAQFMNLSLSYLNDTIRLVTGFSVTYYIQQEVVREAQRLLCKTDLNVKEIAYDLGFEDEKYFNRLFSKVCGQSPGFFRKEWNNNVFANSDENVKL